MKSFHREWLRMHPSDKPLPHDDQELVDLVNSAADLSEEEDVPGYIFLPAPRVDAIVNEMRANLAKNVKRYREPGSPPPRPARVWTPGIMDNIRARLYHGRHGF